MIPEELVSLPYAPAAEADPWRIRPDQRLFERLGDQPRAGGGQRRSTVRRRIEQLGNAEIEKLWDTLLAHQNVRGLDVPVHDPFLVSELHRRAHRAEQFQTLPYRKRRGVFQQRRAVHQLEVLRRKRYRGQNSDRINRPARGVVDPNALGQRRALTFSRAWLLSEDNVNRLDFLAPLKTSKRGQAAHAAIRSVCPTMEKDRVMYKDLARIAELIASGKVAEVIR